MRTLLACLILLSLVTAPSVRAIEISSGEDLNSVCEAADGFSDCVAYLNIVYQTAKAIADMNASRPFHVAGSCGPDQGIDTVPLSVALRSAWREYAKQHAEQLQTLAVRHALLAFERKWPCKP